MAANCASCAGDWAFDPTKPRKEHKDCDWLHGAGAGADVPLNDSATAYLASCDGSDAPAAKPVVVVKPATAKYKPTAKLYKAPKARRSL
mmetsp:Transcript_29356/g.97165  ORF Transcript_29356/g.97165 Transcript_29356/m.97165 type:complete len:89 (-) Transcript_29356:25-291(-)